MVDRLVPVPYQVPVPVERLILVQVPVQVPVYHPIPVPYPVFMPATALDYTPAAPHHLLCASPAIAPPHGRLALPAPVPLLPTAGKRSANEALSDTTSPHGNTASQRTAKKYRKIDQSDWPPMWISEYAVFRDHPKDRVMRRALWKGWPPELRRQVWHLVSAGVRQQMDDWDAEGDHPPRPEELSQVENQSEATSHDWKEGARIGEASNPGPKGHRSGSRAPGVNQQHEKAPARWHGTRAAPQAPRPLPPLFNHMTNQTIGTPGNDARSGAKDLRPGRPVRSLPESSRPSRGGSSGVCVDHRRGVSRHAVNSETEQPEGLKHLLLLIQDLKDQLLQVEADVQGMAAPRPNRHGRRD